MTTFAAVLAALTVDALNGFDRDAAIAAGWSASAASDWQRAHDTYFHPANTVALELARRHGFAVQQLIYIEKKLAKLSAGNGGGEGAVDVDAIRFELLSQPRSFAGLEAAAKKLIPSPTPAPVTRIRFGASRGGMRGINITADERRAADLEHALAAHTTGEEKVDALFAMLAGHGGVTPAAPRPVVLVPLAEHTRILSGSGDEITLMLSDGTSITGADYLALLADELDVALIHPTEGAVNAYRATRHANAKQRLLATVVTPGCAWVGCKAAASACEVHHVNAWKHGGETNLNNLVMLCRYHNRVNNDDPHTTGGKKRRRRKAGRIITLNGRPTWMSWRGYTTTNTHHPPGAMELLFGPAPSAGRRL